MGLLNIIIIFFITYLQKSCNFIYIQLVEYFVCDHIFKDQRKIKAKLLTKNIEGDGTAAVVL